jgi:nitrile hydratase
MNGIHDMGGMTDFGPVRPEPLEPAFHASWERRVLGLVHTIIDRPHNLDEFRFAIERLDPVVYLSDSYYQRWLDALERYLVEKGVVTPEEMAVALLGWQPQPGRPLPDVDHAVAEPSVAFVPFRPDDRVIARNINPAGHTRLPRYVRGKEGTIERFLGTFVFPDTNALGRGEHPEPCYAVRFDVRDLWGEDARPGDTVCVDLWQSYLTPVDEPGQSGTGTQA